MDKKNIYLDMDPGVDDALALFLALQDKNFKLAAISATGGNVYLKNTFFNICFLLENFASYDIPVFWGAENPLKNKLITATQVHGKQGLGNFLPLKKNHQLPPEKNLFKNLSFYKNQPQNKKVFCATGPLTNLAKIILKDKNFFKTFNQVVVMGGAVFIAGNITPVSEFNFYVDALAAKIVLQNILKIKIIPLNITHQVALTEKELNKLKGKKIHIFLKKLLTPIFNFHQKNTGFSGLYLHDPLAIAFALQNNFIEFEEMFLQIESKGEWTKGMLIADRREKTEKNFYKHYVGLKVNSKKFKNYFWETISQIKF